MRSSRQMNRFAVTFSILPILASLTFLLGPAAALHAQNSEQVEVGPPPLHRVAPPAASASARELEAIGDELEAGKNFLDAIDYYEAALQKDPSSAVLMNKVGLSQLLLRRYKDAVKSFERAIKTDKTYANAYANLAVVYYEEAGARMRPGSSYAKSIKYYDKAIQLDASQAVFFNNRAASEFARKEYERATADYNHAIELDPEIFERTSRGPAIQAKLPSPGDIARYDYVLAKLFARNGSADRSLHYLKKAIEEGYPHINDVYKDNEFSALRKDPRFAELMAAKTVVVQN